MQRPKSLAQQFNSASIHPINNTTNNIPSKMSTPSESNWNVNDDTLRDVPNFYPLDKNSQFVHDRPSRVASRISECCRIMSVQASFDDDMATANLRTSEHVEIHLSLWKSSSSSQPSPPPEENNDTNNNTNNNTPITIVEAQRRNGDAVAYHKYCRNILSAALGTFSSQGYLNLTQDQQNKMLKRSSILQGLKKERSRRNFSEDNNGGGDDDDDGDTKIDGSSIPRPSTASAIASGVIPTTTTPFLVEAEDALLALEIAASLIKKDRMDARQLGIETLCLLTDPIKAGMQTALIASKVVLFGSVDAGMEVNALDDDYMPSEDLGIREAILSLVQFGKLGEYADFDDVEEDDGNVGSAGGGGAAYDTVGSGSADGGIGHSGSGSGGVGSGGIGAPEDKEFNALLHNLALAVLANALDVLEQCGDQMSTIGTNNASSTSATTATSALAKADFTKAEEALEDSNANDNNTTTNVSTFLEETQEISKKELLSTLLNVLGRAESKPHDACLSAQCLKSLFQASRRAKRRARDLNAKQIVNTALDVGRRTHVKLETETKKIMKELEKTDDMDENNNNNRNNEDESEEEEDGDDYY